MEFVEGFVEGVPPDFVVHKNHIVYRLIHEDKVQYTVLRPGVHRTVTNPNYEWKQTHYMVIEEPSAKSASVAHGALTTENPFTGLPGNSQSENKPFKKAWDEAGEEAKRRTLTPDDRIDAMVEALNNHLEEMEKVSNDRFTVLEERVSTLAKSTEHLMDIVNVLIRRVVELEGKR